MVSRRWWKRFSSKRQSCLGESNGLTTTAHYKKTTESAAGCWHFILDIYIYIYMGCVASGSDCICFFGDSTHSLASSSFTFFLCSSRHLGLPMPRTARLSKGPWWLTIPEAAFLLMVCESSYPVVATGRTIPLLKWIKEVFQPSQEITQISSMNSILG